MKPAYEDWQSDPLTEWKAKAAVANADILAERLVEYWKALKNLTLIAGRGTAYKYRSYFERPLARVRFGLGCPRWYQALRLGPGHREVTNADQAGVGRIGYGEGRYGEGVFGGGEQIVIELDNGEKRALSAVMHTVMYIWEKLLTDMGL